MKNILFLGFVCLILASLAGVFVQYDANGNPIFSDTPMGDNAKRVDLPASSSTTAPAVVNKPVNASSGTVALQAAPARQPYQSFTFSSPVDQDSIQNQPSLKVQMKLDPPLQSGDKVQILLDGSPLGSAMPQMDFDLPVPDRGTHQLSAQVLDAQNRVIAQANSITIFVHHVALGGPGIR